MVAEPDPVASGRTDLPHQPFAACKQCKLGNWDCLEVEGGLGQLDDALHAAREAFEAEPGQNNGQNSMMIAAQKMMIHALPYKH